MSRNVRIKIKKNNNSSQREPGPPVLKHRRLTSVENMFTDGIRRHLKLYSILVVVHRLLRFSSMKVLLLPPEVLSVAVLILSFVARLSLLTKTDPCHLLHIPATVRSLKTKTFVTLHCPNGVLLLPEIILRHDQIFFISFGFY